MIDMSATNASRDAQHDDIDVVIAQIIDDEEQGVGKDRQWWLERYPEFAEEIASFFSFADQFEARSDIGETDTYPPKPQATATLLSANRPIHVLGMRFRIGEEMRGGMGCVYVLHLDSHLATSQPVVIKTILPPESWNKQRRTTASSCNARYAAMLLRFQRESMNWVRLPQHTNVIDAFCVENLGGRPYLLMDYADSGDLAVWIRDRRLTLERCVDFALQFCAGMSHAVTEAGLVHRDIKPSNILVHQGNMVKITDLGLAKAFAADFSFEGGEIADSADLSGAGAGTIAYMAPEQFLSLSAADTRSDIFSFGATLFEMLTGQRVFNSYNAYRAKLENISLSRPSEKNADVPAALDDIVAKCLAFEPAERFQTFVELAKALNATGIARNRVTSKRAGRSPPPSIPADAPRYDIISLIALGRLPEAEKLARKATLAEPENGHHWTTLGMALAEQGKFREALGCYENATQLTPDNANAWADRALVLKELGMVDEAIRLAHHAVSVDRTCSEAWAALGCCEFARQSFAKSVEFLQEAVSLNPQNWQALTNLAMSHANLGMEDDAFDAASAAIEINRNSMAWFTVAGIEAQRGNLDEALTAIEHCLRIDKHHAPSWAIRGMLLWEMRHGPAIGRVADAADSLRNALRLNPADEHARIVLRQIELEMT